MRKKDSDQLNPQNEPSHEIGNPEQEQEFGFGFETEKAGPTGWATRVGKRLGKKWGSGKKSGVMGRGSLSNRSPVTGMFSRVQNFVAENSKLGFYIFLVVFVFLAGMLTVQTMRLGDATDQIQETKRKTRKKLATCKTALKSYVKSFHSADKQQREGNRVMARQSHFVSSLSDLALRREKALSKMDEQDESLVEEIDKLGESKSPEVRKAQKKLAKILKRREFHRRKVDKISAQMDEKIAKLDQQLSNDQAPRSPQVPNDAKLARKDAEKRMKQKRAATSSPAKK